MIETDAPSEPATLLLVEDDRNLALLQAQMLMTRQYRVLTCPSGEEALTMVQSGTPMDLILMDVDLGRGMTGIETANLITRDKDLPVLFLSSHAEPEIVEEAEKTFSYGYVMKSQELPVLFTAIEMALKLHRARLELKKRERELAAALRAKELSMHELHHRVKNSLNMINGIAALEARQSAEPGVQEALRNIQSRIRSLADLYGLLENSDSISDIPLDHYMAKLKVAFSSIFSTALHQVTLCFTVDPVVLHISDAIPLGIIINEFLTNSVKYAFPPGRDGSITVRMKREKEELHMDISDDGIGLPEGFSLPDAESFGFTIVKQLTCQLKGTLEHRGGPGASFHLTIPLPEDLC